MEFFTLFTACPMAISKIGWLQPLHLTKLAQKPSPSSLSQIFLLPSLLQSREARPSVTKPCYHFFPTTSVVKYKRLHPIWSYIRKASTSKTSGQSFSPISDSLLHAASPIVSYQVHHFIPTLLVVTYKASYSALALIIRILSKPSPHPVSPIVSYQVHCSILTLLVVTYKASYSTLALIVRILSKPSPHLSQIHWSYLRTKGSFIST
jgi:hypothetical protein